MYEESLPDHSHTILIHGKLFGTQGETLVPANSVFVMGDNRIMSIDIRDFGTIHTTNIVTKPAVTWIRSLDCS